MDWLQGMNRVIEHIEENLTEPAQYETLARIAGSSSYEFSRIFSFLTGVSVSEYVRRRRLSRAVFDIQHGGKIIDVALKYCYESPAAFTRAFKELHGVAPSSVRKTNVPLKTFPAIKFVLTIKGVNEMTFRIVEKPAITVVGKKFTFNHHETPDIIGDLWKNMPKETLDTLKALADGGFKGYLGVFSRCYLAHTDYMIAVESNAEPPVGFEKYSIPAVRWAVFEKGDGLHERVYTEWLPSSDYKRASRLYPTVEFHGNTNAPNGDFNEMWIPVDSPADIERKFSQAKKELALLEARFAKAKPVDIDLKTLAPHKSANKEMTMNYTNDGLVLHTPLGDSRMGTPLNFSVPLKIELRAKTDSTNIRIYYAGGENNPHGGWIMLNWHGYRNHISAQITNPLKDMLHISDPSRPNEYWYSNCGKVPINEFVDVEWLLGEKVMAIKVNGELRFASCEFDYIEAFKTPGYGISGPVYPAAGRGSTVTVKSLKITELT